MTENPTFLFVPGAWHPPSCFNSLTTILSQKGYDYRYVQLASVGGSPPVQSIDPDVQIIRETTQSLLDEGKNIIVVMHSYGGVIGSEAMKYFVDEETGQLQGSNSGAKIVRLVYLAAFVLSKGGSLMAALNFKDLPWWDINGDIVIAKTPHAIFYNDMSEAAAAPHIKALKPHAYHTFSTPTSFTAYKYIPTAYLLCENDIAIPLGPQKGMIEGARAEVPEAFDIVETCSASHSPFLSIPDTVATFLLRCATGNATS